MIPSNDQRFFSVTGYSLFHGHADYRVKGNPFAMDSQVTGYKENTGKSFTLQRENTSSVAALLKDIQP